MSPIPYNRILLKISGEQLGDGIGGLSEIALQAMTDTVMELHQAGVETGIVVGGGNWLRGKQGGCALRLSRVAGDQIGMLSTIMNGLALQDYFLAANIPSALMSAIECPKIASPFNAMRAIQLLKSGTVTLFVGGTGNPFFTTDTTAALRACEINADILLKATKVDGIYSDDPIAIPEAKRYSELTHRDVLDQRLEVMDTTAYTLCMEKSLPILVFKWEHGKSILQVLADTTQGTLVAT